MFGPKYEIIESKNILDNEVEKSINDKHNKPTEKKKLKKKLLKIFLNLKKDKRS